MFEEHQDIGLVGAESNYRSQIMHGDKQSHKKSSVKQIRLEESMDNYC